MIPSLVESVSTGLMDWAMASSLVAWSMVEYVDVVISFTFATGFACEIPALVVGLVWLRICRREQIASHRRFVLPLVFFVAAWVTPTLDAYNQTIVAASCYLQFELGLLLARLVPADEPQAAVP